METDIAIVVEVCVFLGMSMNEKGQVVNRWHMTLISLIDR